MKKLLIFTLLLLPLTVLAQEVVLRAGEVYRFDEGTGKWSEKPLPIKTSLYFGDSIRSLTSFSIEVPLSWKNLFKKRIYTYIKYPGGVRLSDKLIEKSDRYYRADTRVIVQGDNVALIEHLKWIQNNENIEPSFNVEFEIYDSNDWNSLKKKTIISKFIPITLSIINKESFDIYAYIFWKMDKWEKLGDNSECIRISPFSSYEKSFSLANYYGKQSVLLVTTQELISEHDIDSLLDGYHKASYHSELSDIVGSDVIHFNIGD